MNIIPTASFALTGVAALVLTCTPATAALTASQVEAIARQVTVKIDASTPGSGVIIKRDGNTYTLLTAAHVVETKDDYEIITNQGQRYAIVPDSIAKIPNLDLATVQFVSEQQLAIAELGNSNEAKAGDPCYVSGHPLALNTYETQYRLSPGYVASNSIIPNNDGYSIAYFNETYQGMSGGPVLDSQGKVIGIHGRTLSPYTSSGGVAKISGIKLGVNFAIPTSAYLGQINISNPAEELFVKGVQSLTKIRIDHAYMNNFSSNKYSEAIRYFDEAIRLKPNYGAAFIMRGISFSAQGDAQRALSDLTQGININSNPPLVYFFRASTYLQLNMKDKAWQDIELWKQADPENPAVASTIASFKFSDSNSSQELDSLIQENPDNAQLYIQKAVKIMRVNGKIDARKAIGFLDKAIEIDPGISEAYYLRGLMYKNLGETANSFNDLKAAKDVSPELYRFDPTIYSVIEENNPDSIEELKELNPQVDSAIIHVTKASTLIMDKADYRAALEEIDIALKINPNLAQAYLLRGSAFLELGKRAEAIQSFKKLKMIDPQLYKSGNIEAIVQLLQRY